MPRLYIISGPNGSGKTTASYGVLPELLDCSEFVNSDELRKVKYLFDRREDFCIETTLATRALLKITRNAQEKGYYVTVLYFWLNSPDIAVQRVAARVKAGGHDIPEETIRRRYTMGLNYLFHDYMQTCDKWILADNSNPPFDVIAEGSKKGLVIRDMERYNTVKSLVTDQTESHTPIRDVAEYIAREIAKAPVAHDGVPYQEEK